MVDGYATVADSVIPPGVWGYARIGAYPYDPAKARKLLAEAGYPNGFEFTLWTPVGRYLMDKQMAEAIQAQMAAVGVKMKIQTWDFQALMSEVKKGQFDAVLLGWSASSADADQAMFPVFESTQWPPNSNRALYRNATVDKLLNDAKKEVNPARRAQDVQGRPEADHGRRRLDHPVLSQAERSLPLLAFWPPSLSLRCIFSAAFQPTGLLASPYSSSSYCSGATSRCLRPSAMGARRASAWRRFA